MHLDHDEQRHRPDAERLGRSRLPLDHQPGRPAARCCWARCRDAGPLAPGQSVTGSASATIPLGDSGTYQIIVVADATNQLIEPGGTANSATQAINITLAPYADLAVSNVVAPRRRSATRPTPTISWTVTNIGTGAGQTTHLDRRDHRLADRQRRRPECRRPGRYPHTGGLAVNAELHPDADVRRCRRASPGATTCSSRPTPATRSSRTAQRPTTSPKTPNNFDVMPIPYADLVVSSIDVPQPAGSGLPLNVTWTVTNQGIGLTSVPSWDDDLALASDPAGKNIIKDYGLFNHLGPDRPGRQLRAHGPGHAARRPERHLLLRRHRGREQPAVRVHLRQRHRQHHASRPPFTINLTPPPDLTVTNVSAPTTAEEGSTIQVSWTVQNVGPGGASGTWQDEVVLQQAGQPNAQFLRAGHVQQLQRPRRRASRTAAPRRSPCRSHISGLYNVEVITNYDGAPVRERGDRQQHGHRLASR